MLITTRLVCLALACGAPFLSAQASRQGDIPPRFARECVPSRVTGTPPACNGNDLCSFLHPVCADPCTTLTYSRGKCTGPVTICSCTEFDNVGYARLCRDCSCDNYWGGHCTDDQGTYGSGSITHSECSS